MCDGEYCSDWDEECVMVNTVVTGMKSVLAKALIPLLLFIEVSENNPWIVTLGNGLCTEE